MKPRIKGVNFLKISKGIFLLFFSLTISACAKKPEFGTEIVSGQVIDQTTGGGIPFASLGLIQDKNFLPDTVGNEGHFSTDSNGFFKFSVQEHQTTDYYINAIARNYFDDYPVSIDNFNSSISIPLLPKSYLNLHFNTSLLNDTVIFNETITQYRLNQFIINKTYIDTVFQNKILKRTINGNMMNHFSWAIKKNGKIQNFADSIKVNAFDSINYNIIF